MTRDSSAHCSPRYETHDQINLHWARIRCDYRHKENNNYGYCVKDSFILMFRDNRVSSGQVPTALDH